MACNCNRKRTNRNATANSNRREVQTSFTLIKKDGTKEVFGSKLEANAARVRAGGGLVK